MTGRSLRAVLVVVTSCAFLWACSSGADRRNGSEGPATATEPSSSTGFLRGTVRLASTQIPEPELIQNTTDPDICGLVQQREDLLVDPEDRGIANVIVSLRNVPTDMLPPSQPTRLVLDNRDCQFDPRVAVLTAGSTIEAVSHDAVLHTVHLYGALERNIALPNESVTVTVTAEELGMIAVLCDAHGWMKAFIRIDSHPYHAVTDAEGAFAIESVPPGAYELDVWHERLGTQSLSVRIEPGASTAIEIMYDIEGR